MPNTKLARASRRQLQGSGQHRRNTASYKFSGVESCLDAQVSSGRYLARTSLRLPGCLGRRHSNRFRCHRVAVWAAAARSQIQRRPQRAISMGIGLAPGRVRPPIKGRTRINQPYLLAMGGPPTAINRRFDNALVDQPGNALPRTDGTDCP